MFDPARERRALHSAYPERSVSQEGWFDRQGARLFSSLRRRHRVRLCRNTTIVEQVAAQGHELSRLSDEQLTERAMQVRQSLRRDGLSEERVCRSFALIREVAQRTLGQRHYDVQILGGWVLLNGCIAEMATGEGKTLTATLAAATIAMAGVPVHVITVNDYLTGRDAREMAPLYERLGLSVGAVIHELDPVARRSAYGCDVTYCCNKELAFDYLRDRLVVGRQPNRIQLQLERLYGDEARVRQLVLRGLCFGIVDEADSVLVDEARVPLIISGAGGEVPEKIIYQMALDFARGLVRGQDFSLDGRERTIRLTSSGRTTLTNRVVGFTGLWSGPRRREELVRQALTALHLFQRDVHYLVRGEKVQIIDEYTGRVMGDRSWEHGLHQMIELKEGCPVTPMNRPLARITYQRLFRRYLWLSGMTGTAQEVAGELWNVYRLATVTVPTNRPLQRRWMGERLFATADQKWEAVVERIRALREQGRPVLVGTRSVEASEILSQQLTNAQIEHVVLNARQDQEEAAVVAAAGESGRVTVATNMAGRGTDIKVLRSVAQAGGLHVIATERHEATRIDRQLYGRTGRQGDPGSYETVMSLDDELLVASRGRVIRWVASLLLKPGTPLQGCPTQWLVRLAQRSAERLHARMRRDLLQHEDQLESALAFSGRVE
ncbi:Protein translocase subunit SecA 2 [Candidatus Nitrospira nitrosa]|uniref:Protein translocase subunit SecA n=1 Tax=Candidatus Nitrospira nitrosa TaxID=1742972 RepID=A0A0S4LIY2_9BACT|nr:preprotein translocase subunit SecA [Candidatus Nitrospira nitrosa]CUS37537.1 Protein translocase subunit SecA 2 [Candidatus Nitrospira nitrosa]